MNVRLIGVLAGAIAVALIVAGCGGSSDNTESTASLTKAEFLKKGNAICAKGSKELNEEFASYAKENPQINKRKPTNAEAEEIAETILIPGVKKQVDGVRALGAPEGEEEQVEEILAAAEEGIEELEKDPVAAVTSESEQAFARANKLSREYGLTACGEEEGNEKG